MLQFAEWLQSTPLSLLIETQGWIIPILQTIHIVMIGIVFVSVLMIALRMLGRVRMDQPFVDVLDRFSPWLWAALTVNLITGLLLTIGEPARQFYSFSYWAKMALILIGVASILAFRRSLGPRAALASGDPAFSTSARIGAVAVVVIWLAIIFLGRAIAYDIEVWGGLSLATRA